MEVIIDTKYSRQHQTDWYENVRNEFFSKNISHSKRTFSYLIITIYRSDIFQGDCISSREVDIN